MSDGKRYLIFYTFDDVDSVGDVDKVAEILKADDVKNEINDTQPQQK